MKVAVRPMRVKGREIPHKELLQRPVSVGRLEVREQRSSMLHRATTTARLLSLNQSAPLDVLPMLRSAELLWLRDEELRLTGCELEDGAEYVQTWNVKVLGC